ncbi:MAG: type II secretion system F family protein [Bacilli bacterium]
MKNSIYRKRTIARIERKYDLLGKNPKTLTFLNLRLITCLLVLILFILIFELGIIIGPILSILLYYLIEFFYFDFRIISRKKNLENDAIIFFGMLLLGLKNNNLVTSLTMASKKKDNLLAMEFVKVVNDTKLGKSLKDALTDVKKRIPSDSINNIILSIEESIDNSSNLINTLEHHLEHLQEKILYDKRKNIGLVPLKIKIITVIFIVLSYGLVLYTLKGLELI